MLVDSQQEKYRVTVNSGFVWISRFQAQVFCMMAGTEFAYCDTKWTESLLDQSSQHET